MKCPGCGRQHEMLHGNPWISEAVCSFCISAWYEGASIRGGPKGVRKESRQLQRLQPETQGKEP